MSAGIETACAELDLLLENCLVSWVEGCELKRQGVKVPPGPQASYLERVTRIVHAKSALRSVLADLPQAGAEEFENLDQTMVDAWRGRDLAVPVIVSVACRCTSVLEAEERCSPERKCSGRGTVRNWNGYISERGGGRGNCACVSEAGPWDEQDEDVVISGEPAFNPDTEATDKTQAANGQPNQSKAGDMTDGTTAETASAAVKSAERRTGQRRRSGKKGS